MNALLDQRARLARPDIYADPNIIGRTAGVTILKDFRQSKYAQLIPLMTMDALANQGFTHQVSVPVAPAAQHVSLKNGYESIAEVFYDEPNEVFTLTPEEQEKHADLLKEFRGKRPSII